MSKSVMGWCLEWNFEQHFQSMSAANIASLAHIQGKQVSIANAKLAIFATDMLCESCSNFILNSWNFFAYSFLKADMFLSQNSFLYIFWGVS